MEYNRLYILYRGSDTFKHHLFIYYSYAVDHYTWDGSSLEKIDSSYPVLESPKTKRFPKEVDFLKNKVAEAFSKEHPAEEIKTISYKGVYREIRIGELLLPAKDKGIIGHIVI